jgi:hypothetical protein
MFVTRQPVLRMVVIVLFILPGSLINIFSTVLMWNDEGLLPLTDTQRGMLTLLLVAAIIILSIIMIWGNASVLLVGRRLARSRAGRNRTSFKAVRGEARRFILPLLLTELLRACFILLWGLLLIIPGVVYAIRTAFFEVVTVAEEVTYRSALRRSSEVISGKTWSALWRIVVIMCITILPVNIFTLLLYRLVEDAKLTLLIDILDASLNGLVAPLYLCSMIALYDTLKRMPTAKRSARNA